MIVKILFFKWELLCCLIIVCVCLFGLIWIFDKCLIFVLICWCFLLKCVYFFLEIILSLYFIFVNFKLVLLWCSNKWYFVCDVSKW